MTDNMQEMSVEAAEAIAQETEEKAKAWAYLELPKPYVNERKKGDRTFYSCVIPNGTFLRDVDISGYQFTAPIVDEPVTNWETMERDPNAKYYSICVLNRDIKIVKNAKNEAGEWNRVDEMKVDPAELRKAIQAGYRNYKKQKEQEMAVDVPDVPGAPDMPEQNMAAPKKNKAR